MSWKRVQGHEAQMEAFDRLVRSGRLAHAYLFIGPTGIGKRLFGNELAKVLLCEGRRGPRFEACDQCDACRLFDSGTHPDFFQTTRPAETLDVPIESVRELCRSLSLKPARGQRKVAVLDDADDLNEFAANCFLKTLEEPPPGSVLLLIGTTGDRQLSTILSRCQIVRFLPLTEATVVEVLRGQESVPADLIPKLTRLCGGSPGQALALADPELWAFRSNLLQGLTAPDWNSLTLAEEWSRFVEEAGKESAVQRRRATLALRLLIELIRDAVSLMVGGTPKLSEPDELQILQRLLENTNAEGLMDLLERCLDSDAQIDRRVQLVLILEALMDAFGQMRPTSQ